MLPAESGDIDMSYFQVNDKCNGCLACVQNCPANAIDFLDTDQERTLRHNMARCARCGNCWRVCPREAIEFQHFLQNQWDDVIALDLVLCKICGETLYTSAFDKTLAKKLGEENVPLCEKHKKALGFKVNTHFIGSKEVAQ